MHTNLVNGNHALLRKESFGGTLLLVKTGKRIYLNPKEFEDVKKGSVLTYELATELQVDHKPVVITEPAKLYLERFSAPDTLFLEVTRACNLTCSHCFNDSGKALSTQLTQEQLEAVIDDAAASGVQEIRFTGGEPMVHNGIISLIHRASALGLRCSIGTNGALVTRYKANQLIDSGLRAAVVSLDGLEKRHDSIRGQSSFRHAIQGLERLRDRDIDVRVNIVVMRSNLPDLPALLEMLSSQNISVFMRRLILSGRATSSSPEMLTAEEYLELRRRLQDILKNSRGLIEGHYMSDPGNQSQSRIELPFNRKDCKAGQRGLVVLPDGNIQTCGFLAPLGERSVGLLPEQKLSDVWSKLGSSQHILDFEKQLIPYNESTLGPKTNCLAVAVAGQEPLVQLTHKGK